MTKSKRVQEDSDEKKHSPKDANDVLTEKDQASEKVEVPTDGTNARSSAQNGVINRGFKTSAAGGKGSSSIALIPDCGDGAISRPIKQAKDVIFFNGSVDNKLMLWALLIAGSYREMETLSARFCCL